MYDAARLGSPSALLGRHTGATRPGLALPLFLPLLNVSIFEQTSPHPLGAAVRVYEGDTVPDNNNNNTVRKRKKKRTEKQGAQAEPPAQCLRTADLGVTARLGYTTVNDGCIKTTSSLLSNLRYLENNHSISNFHLHDLLDSSPFIPSSTHRSVVLLSFFYSAIAELGNSSTTKLQFPTLTNMAPPAVNAQAPQPTGRRETIIHWTCVCFSMEYLLQTIITMHFICFICGSC